MPKQKTNLTQRFAEKVAPTSKEYYVWDGEITGLGLRVIPTGGKTYVLKYRNKHGKQRKYKIGNQRDLDMEGVRKIARRLKAQIAEGSDPSANRREDRDQLTFKEYAKLFMEEYAKKHIKSSTAIGYDRYLRCYLLDALGNKPLPIAFSAPEVRKFYFSMSGKRGTANRSLMLLSKMFNYARAKELIKDMDNPLTGIDKAQRYKEKKCTRFLNNEEIKRLGEVLSERERNRMEQPESIYAAIRLLIFTGCRLNEILKLRWDDIDFNKRVINLRDSKTGKGTVFLNDPALNVLNSIERMDNNPYVIYGKVEGQHLINLQKAWRRIRKLAGLDDVRIHDLRHTFASVGANAGVGQFMLAALLRHSQIETTERYLHADTNPVLEQSNFIGDRIESLLAGVEP